VQQFKKVSYIEAVKIIADLCKIDISKFSYQFTNSILDPKIKVFYDLNTHVNNYYEGFLYNDENKSRLEYLHRRGLDDTIIKHFHLGYAPAQAKFIYEICVNKDNMFGDDYDKNLI
jgi:DNA primase